MTDLVDWLSCSPQLEDQLDAGEGVAAVSAGSSCRERKLVNRRYSLSGASLLEVILASFLVGIVSLGMVEFFARGRASFDQEERKRVATLLAQEALERTVATPYAEIVNGNFSRTVADIPYAINVAVQENTPEAEMKTIRSVVRWNATPTVQRTVSLTTIIFDN